MSKVIEGLKYSKDHEWLRIEDGKAVVGITDYAQDSLGEIVYIELPETGTKVEAHEHVSDIESVKAASEIISPAAGTVCEVNQELDGSPELLNEDCYGNFIYKLEGCAVPDDLLDAAAYKEYLETL